MQDWYSPEEVVDLQRAARSRGRIVRNVLFGVALLILSLATVAQVLFALGW